MGDCIGLIGIGLLGSAIAHRLLGAGHRVAAYDVDPEKRRRFAERGGIAADSVADVARQCRIVVLAVFNTQQVTEVLEGAGGLLASGPNRHVAVCMSTCDPDDIATLAERTGARGLPLLEVPISGTAIQVERGDGVALIAGEDAAVREARPVIDAICPKGYELGAAGNGGRAKLAINLILGMNRAAIAEGVAFAEKLGLDRGRFMEVAKGSAAYSQVMDVKGHLWVNDRFDPPLSRVDQSLKDFKLMVEVGRRVGLGLPLASLYVDLLEGCVAHDEATLDNAAIIREIRRRHA